VKVLLANSEPFSHNNGLVEVALCGPTASGGVARTLAPEGKLTASLLRYGYV
jgi:hypothetical protein